MQGKLRCRLLCEDHAQEGLFRPILERMFKNRVRVAPYKPHGGDKFVLQSLFSLAAYVRQRPQEAVGLLVVLDGDAGGLKTRLEEIRRAAQLTGAAWESRIAACIPTRNVETWIRWLCGIRGLNEQTDYKHICEREIERGEIRFREAAAAWFSPLTDEGRQAEERHLPALVHGRMEIDRLRLAARG